MILGKLSTHQGRLHSKTTQTQETQTELNEESKQARDEGKNGGREEKVVWEGIKGGEGHYGSLNVLIHVHCNFSVV